MAMAGLSRLILLLLLALLLLFLVTRAPEWSRRLQARLESGPSHWPALECTRLFRQQGQIAQAFSAAPCFDPRFQRPPPLFL
jgi:hypothetical protein